MKKIFSSFVMALILTVSAMAQVPGAFKYQAVARDGAGKPMSEQAMTVRISIVKGTLVEYSEVHAVVTNEFGLFTVEVGRGSAEQGSFQDVAWNDDVHFLRVEVDPQGGGNFMFLGISELLSVPYAQHARTVEFNDDADADPTNEIQDIRLTGSVIKLTNNPDATEVDLSQFNTDSQQLDYDGDNFTLTLENGGSVNLSNLKNDADADPTNELQTLDQNGVIVTLSHGGGTINVEDADADPLNELQTISQSGNTITLSQGGGSVTIVELDDDPTNEIQDLTLHSNYLYITNHPNPTIVDLSYLLDNTDQQSLSFDNQTGILSLQNGGTVDLSVLVDDADADPANELQTISKSGDDIILSNGGGSVDISAYMDNTDEQTLSLNGTELSISNGNMIDLVSFMDNTDAQTLSLNNDSLVISNGNVVMMSNYMEMGDNAGGDLTGVYPNPSITAGAVTTAKIQDAAVTTDKIADNSVTSTKLEQNLTLTGATLMWGDATVTGEMDIFGDAIIYGNSYFFSEASFDDNINMNGNTIVQVGTPVANGDAANKQYVDNAAAIAGSQSLSLSGTELTISGGNMIDLVSFMDNTDAQTISLVDDTLYISNGNFVDLSGYTNTDNQTLSVSGTELTISSGNMVDLVSFMDNTDAQTLVLSNDSLYISNGNVVMLSDYMATGDAASGDLTGSFPSPSIAADAVTTAKIQNGAITSVKLADGSVNTVKVADEAITSAKIADLTITSTDIASNAITTAKILDFNVTNAKLGNSAVTSPKIMDGAVTNSKLADDIVSTAKIQDDAVTNVKLADNAVTSSKLASNLTLNGNTIFTGAIEAMYATADGSLGNYAAGSETAIRAVPDGVDLTIDLPQASACPGRIYVIRNVDDTFDVILTPFGADMIDDNAHVGSLTITPNGSVMLMSIGTEWLVLMKY